MSEEKKHGHWIHEVEKNDSFVKGYKVLPDCVCSVCGYHSNRAKTVCPVCESIMDEPAEIHTELKED